MSFDRFMRSTFMAGCAGLGIASALFFVAPGNSASADSGANFSKGEARAKAQWNENRSGYLNCSGKGTIIVSSEWLPEAGVDIAAKSSGPPNSPSYGYSVAAHGSPIPGPDTQGIPITTTDFWDTHLREGRWSVHTDGWYLRANATCSSGNRQAAAGSARAASKKDDSVVVNLGDKSCPQGKYVTIIAGFPTDRTVKWRSTATSPYKTVSFGWFPTIQVVKTNERYINDIVVHYAQGRGESPGELHLCQPARTWTSRIRRDK